METKKKKFAQLSKSFKATYNSDDDLTKEERKRIKYSANPDKTRKEIWKNKGFFEKTKKMLKGMAYGDKTKKVKPFGK